MNKAVELLKNRVFFLATTEGDQARVRPFGAVADINGKLYICTSNNKNCFKQMSQNPKVEMSGMIGDDRWYRVAGTVKADSNIEAKTEFLKQNPSLANLYKVDDGLFEILYFVSGQVDVFSYKGLEESYEL